MKSKGHRWAPVVELSPWPAEVLHPARPECGAQCPASECPPERVLKKEPAAMNLLLVLKVRVRRYWPVA
eukprot:11153462-Alexandrium_andersonii.AAC.1